MSYWSRSETQWAYLVLLACYVLLVTSYAYGRFSWRWVDDDAMRLTRSSQEVYVHATVSPDSGAYPFGFAYPTLNTFLSHLTGLSLESVQRFVQPFLTVMLVPLSYAAFGSLTGSRGAGSLAALLLFSQPEFLFEALRSSHAKLTWATALLMLFLLASSLRSDAAPGRFAVWVLLFYAATFALITSSSFFASQYIVAILLAAVAVLALRRLPRARSLLDRELARLWLVVLSSIVLVFLFIFYIYSPAESQFSALRWELDKLSVLFLGADAQTTNPYAYVGATWTSTPIYLLASSVNWVVLALSLIGWITLGRQQLRRRHLARERQLLWLLYPALASTLGLAAVLDLSGFLSANLQVRLFPHLMIVAIPLAAVAILSIVQRARSWRPTAQWAGGGLLSGGCALLALGAILKLTNEPLLSNRWAFYVPEERDAVDWVGDHVRGNAVSVGYSARLSTLVNWQGGWDEQRVSAVRGNPLNAARYALLSPVLEARAARQGEVLPNVENCQRVYDNGGARLYYSRPETPYQR